MILVSTGLLNFDKITVGENKSKTFTIFNNANYNVNIVILSSHAVFTAIPLSATISANSSKNITVKFEPNNQAIFSSSLTISHNDPIDIGNKIVNVIGEGIKPVILVTPLSLNFGSISVNDLKSLTIIVKNTSITSKLIINNISSSNAKYSITPISFTLQPSSTTLIQQREVTIKFLPTIESIETGTITIYNNSSNEEELEISVQGEGKTPIIHVDKTSINFGNVTINDTKTEIVTVKNTSAEEINLILSNISTNNNKFTKTISNATLKKEETLEIPVTFAPTNTALEIGKLIIQNNAINKEINLQGQGTATPNILVASELVNFGKVGLQKIVEKTLKISNKGQLDLVITNIQSNNSKFTILPVTMIIASADYNIITISYNPTIPNNDLAFLTIMSNDPDLPEAIVNLLGEGVSPVIETSADIDFGIITINGTKNKVLTIKNKGETNLIISDITISDLNFSIESLIYPFEINPNVTKSIDVVFHPTVSGKIDNILLSILSNDYTNPLKTITLKGQSVDAKIKIFPDNSELDFGIVTISETKVLNFDIKNLGVATLNITDIIISTSLQTVIILSKTSVDIGPNITESIAVTFDPLIEAQYVGTLTVKNNSSDIIISIKGEGKYAAIIVDRTTITFAGIVPNDTSIKKLNIINPSQTQLNVNLSINPPFHLSSNAFILNAVSGKEIDIIFTPTNIGLFQNPLNFITNAKAPDNSFLINVEGSALDEASLIVTPLSIDFGTVKKGQNKDKNVKLENKGTKSLTFSTNTTDNDNFTIIPSSGSLLAGQNIFLTVRFGPKKDVLGDVTIGSISEVLTVTSPESINTSYNVQLKGKIENSDIKWTSINLSDNPFYKNVKEFAGTIQDILPPVLAALEIVNSILEIVKKLLIGKQDLLKVVLQQLVIIIDNLLKDLSSTGIYSLFLLPDDHVIYKSLKTDLLGTIDAEGNPVDYSKFNLIHDYFDIVKYGSQVFKNHIIQSYDDLADSRRPQFSNDAYVGGIIFAIDSEDPSEFVENMQKLLSFFGKTFKANYFPPTNVVALSGNDKIKLTFSPNTNGFMPNDYLIFRSEKAGGDEVDYEGTYITDGEIKPRRRDMEGNILKSYMYIGKTNFVDQISSIKKISKTEATNIFAQKKSSLTNLMTALGGEDGTLKFFFEDETVQKDKSYYYTIMSADVLKDKDVAQPGTLFYFEMVESKQEDGKIIQVKKTKESLNLRIFGELSAEVVGTTSDSFIAQTDGMARCRNYRCTNIAKPKSPKRQTMTQDKPEKYEILLEGIPKTSTLKITVEREITTNTGRKVKRNFDIPFSDYTIVANKIVFLKPQFFLINDQVIVDYEYFINVPTKTVGDGKDSEEFQLQSGKNTIYLKNTPVDLYSTIIIIPSFGIKDIKLIDANSGKVEVTNESQESISVWAKYTYFDLESATNFKCIDSVYSTYYFDKATCFDGTTQCSGYVNANCIFNDGTACSNTGISTRKIITYSQTQISTSPTEVKDEEHSIVSSINGKSTIYLKKTPISTDEEIIINPQDDIVSTYKIKSVDTGEIEVTVIRAGDIKVTYFYNAKTETEVADPNLKKQQVVSEDIAFAAFWDSVACQNGTMAQRCDGYSKVLPPGTFRGTYPDWNAIKLGDFLPLTELIEIIQKFINSLLSGTEKLTDSVINFISLIQKKIEYIQGILARIQEMLELLDTIFFDAGIHLLNIPTSKGGNEYLKKSISSAQGGPSSGIDGFTGGVMLSWGSPNFADPTIKAGEALKRLFGITD